MSFGPLRVLNEDWVAPGAGFPQHAHRDMDIITYVISGELLHRDSLGNECRLVSGSLQVMSAGTGVEHSELNGSQDSKAHFLQIWLIPDQLGLPPSYADSQFPVHSGSHGLQLLASGSDASGALPLNLDARLYRATLSGELPVELKIAPGRRLWVQISQGVVMLNGDELRAGDGACFTMENELSLQSTIGGEALVFDLPG